MTAALLMLDYQVGLCQRGPHVMAAALADQVAQRGVLDAAQRVLRGARDAGWLILHARLAFEPTYRLRTNRLPRFDPYERRRAMLADSPEAQIVDQVAPLSTEPVVDKGCVNPFIGTPLRDILAAEGVTHIVLGGVATNLVVESAARHASDSGLQVAVVEDMCAGIDPAMHEFAIMRTLPLFSDVISSRNALDRMGAT